MAKMMESFCCTKEIYDALFAPIQIDILQCIKSLLPTSSAKKPTIIPIFFDSSVAPSGKKKHQGHTIQLWYKKWIEKMLIFSENKMNYQIALCSPFQNGNWSPTYIMSIGPSHLADAARRKILIDRIKFARIIAPPKFITAVAKTSSSMFGGRNLTNKDQVHSEEEVLPSWLQQQLIKSNLSLKSYFVQCQLHQDNIQLTLHQVVKVELVLEEKKVSTIVIQNILISIEDLYDSLCKSLWASIESSSNANNGLLIQCELPKKNAYHQDGESCSFVRQPSSQSYCQQLQKALGAYKNAKVVLKKHLLDEVTDCEDYTFFYEYTSRCILLESPLLMLAYLLCSSFMANLTPWALTRKS